MRNWSLFLCALALTVVGCGDDGGTTDTDSGVRADAGVRVDSGPESDAGPDEDDAGPTGDAGSDDDAGTMADAGSDAGGEEAASFAEVYAIITSNCMPCHTSNSSGGLRFGGNAMSAYNALVDSEGVGVDRETGLTACTPAEAPTARVTPGDADESFLYVKVAEEPADGCGDRMPDGRPALSAAQIETIRSWIEGGALPPT